MDPILVSRVAVPALLCALAGVLVVWPVVRLRRETGARAIAVHRSGTPVERAAAATFLVVQLGILALVAAYTFGGPDAVGAWPPPAALVGSGIGLAVASIALIARAQHQMGSSFRIGIDPERTALVTGGLFRWIRNPIFTGLLALLAALVLLVPSPWTALLWLAALGSLGWQVRLEERHLLALHGDAYRRYASRTGRFVPGVGRLPRTPGGAS